MGQFRIPLQNPLLMPFSLRCVLDARPSGMECNTHFGLALGDLGRGKPLALSSYVSGAVLRITSRLDSISRQFPASLPGRNRLSRPSRMGLNECGRGRMRCESRYLFPTTAKGRNLLSEGTLGSDSSTGRLRSDYRPGHYAGPPQFRQVTSSINIRDGIAVRKSWTSQ